MWSQTCGLRLVPGWSFRSITRLTLSVKRTDHPSLTSYALLMVPHPCMGLCVPPLLHAETVSCWSLCRSSACSHNQLEFIRACCNGRSSYCRSPVLFEKHHSLPSSPSSASHHLSAPSLLQWSLRLEPRGCSIAFPLRAKHSFSLLRSVP